MSKKNKYQAIANEICKQAVIFARVSSDIMRWDIAVFAAKTFVGALRDNVIRSQEYKREQGQWMSCAPVGYLNVSKTDKTPANIIIDEKRAPKVKRLFEEYAKLKELRQKYKNKED